jgi:PAS domain S-box-containing protein
MAQRSHETMTRAELLAEIRRLTLFVEADADVPIVDDVEVYREERHAHAAELLETPRLLQASRDRYAELFDFAPIGYAVLDGQGVLTDVNLTAARLLGGERLRLIGYPFRSFLADRRAFTDLMNLCRRGSAPAETDVEVRARSGAAVPAHLTMKQLSGSESLAPATFVLAIVDLTERRRVEAERLGAEDERRRSERQEQLARAASDAKDRFLAILSHELRTPLTPILFALASLKDTGNVPQSLAPTLEMVRRNVELEARLIDDLLDVTRITQGKMSLAVETVDVHALVEEVVALCADEIRSTDVVVSLELSAATRRVRADGTRLRQVVWNLLKNAVRNTPPDGTITIRAANEVTGRITLSVRDTGAGIAPALLPRLFTPFEQGTDSRGRSMGLGLGLTITKGIIDAHGGRVEAASEGPGRGATFRVELPSLAEPASPRAEARRPPHVAVRARKVLLVEDNRDNAAAITELLRAHGYEVNVAGSVAAAVEEARKGFDVLVSDIGLPDGTGRDLVRHLRADGAVRAIALTGYGMDADVRSNTDAGFVRHLTKPVDPDALLAAIDDVGEPDGELPAEPPATRRLAPGRVMR